MNAFCIINSHILILIIVSLQGEFLAYTYIVKSSSDLEKCLVIHIAIYFLEVLPNEKLDNTMLMVTWDSIAMLIIYVQFNKNT